ncbi:hypothetical protein [Salegentibacter chungangensis]|uniref:Uncharacterized protein n=1 Tax=Salegentibacter chungangensis TaxID=1335724 RepID=A0ABW3NS92_9FLAO
MKTLESIIQNFGNTKEGLTHKRSFLHQNNSSSHGNWYNRRRHAV